MDISLPTACNMSLVEEPFLKWVYYAMDLNTNYHFSCHDNLEEAERADAEVCPVGRENEFIKRSITVTQFKSNEHFHAWKNGLTAKLKRTKKKAAKVRRKNADVVREANTTQWLDAAAHRTVADVPNDVTHSSTASTASTPCSVPNNTSTTFVDSTATDTNNNVVGLAPTDAKHL